MFRLITVAVLFRYLKQFQFLSLCFILYSAEAFTSEGQQVELNIAKLPLEEALNQLLTQSHIQLLFESSTVENFSSPALRGSYSVEAALALLLEGTDLRFKRMNRNMYVISRMSTAEKSSSVADSSQKSSSEANSKLRKKTLLPEVVVVGETHHTISLQEPSTATKVFIPTMEVPRAVEGITAELFHDRGNATLAEAFRDYSSINITDESGLIFLRGFRIHDQSILKGGLPSISRGITSLSLQNVEGIEVAKGANSSLYGYGQPGGVINLIPKMPKPRPFTNLSVSYGNYDNYFAVDANNPLDLDERITQRFNFLIRNEDKHNQGDGSIQQIQVTPSFVYQMDGDKSLSLNMEYNHQEIDGLGGKRVFDKPSPAYQPFFDFLFPNLVEVPFYPYSGSDKKDFQQSDSLDLWTRFKAPLNNTWDYSVAAYAGQSDIDTRTLADLALVNTPFLDFHNVNKIGLVYDAVTIQGSALLDTRQKFEEHFFSTYGDHYADKIGAIQAIYGNTTVPAWSDDRMRIYQILGDISQEAGQAGFDISTHGVLDFAGDTHDLVFGLSYLQRRWQYDGLSYYSGELYDKGTEFIENGELITGFGLHRFSKIGWYYPYGPDLDNVDIVLPDQLATQANLPIDTHYILDRQQPFYAAEESTKSLGFYLQDHISIGEQWRLLFSSGFYRYQRNFYNNLYNEFANFLIGEQWSLSTTDLSYIDDKVSPQLGLVYLPSDDLSIFASSGKQFDIVNGLQSNGSGAEPEVTNAKELGVKWWPLEEFNIAASCFEITKKNYAFFGEINNGFANIRQSGLMKSTGAEINMTGFITPHIKLSSNYSRFKPNLESSAELLASNPQLADTYLQDLLNGVPQQSGSFWLQYQAQPYGSRGWTIGAGLNYVGERTELLQNIVFELDNYLLLDTAITYKNEDFGIALNIDNIQNKEWFAGASTKVNPLPDYMSIISAFSPYHVAIGYGTRVRLTTELFF